MVWAAIINPLKEVAKDFKKIKDEERRDLAALFEITADLLLKIADEFEKDNYPHVECGMIETVGNNIAKHMAKIISKKHRKDVLEYFKPFQSMQNEWDNRHNKTTNSELKKAAGEFKGLAILFRA